MTSRIDHLRGLMLRSRCSAAAKLVLGRNAAEARARFLTFLSAGCVLALAVLKLSGTESPARVALEATLALSFVCLSIVDFRASVAIAIFELVLAGAGGHWASYPLGITGRILLEGVITVRALSIIVGDWCRNGRLPLGRYGIHALMLAVLIPGIWIPLGLFNGNTPHDVVADGNGFFSFAFVLVVVASALRGHGDWFRKLFVAACGANGIVTLGMIVVSATRWVALQPTMSTDLLARLDMGGAIGYMPNGAYRLYLGSSLLLQVGLALTTWQLLSRPRRVWLWLLYAVFWIDLLATYSRGLWLAGVAAVIMVIALGSPTLKRAALVVVATAVMWGLITAGGALNGFSLRDYVFNRSATIISLGPSTSKPSPSKPKPSSSKPKPASKDVSGEISNEMRVRQAKILFRYIKKRPVLGYGFGAVARGWGPGYAFELSYLALLFKAGIIGFLLYLSFPLRLLWDALRIRFGKRSPPRRTVPRSASVPFAIVASILLVGASNPYLFAAFGIIPILVATAWLDDAEPQAAATGQA